MRVWSLGFSVKRIFGGPQFSFFWGQLPCEETEATAAGGAGNIFGSERLPHIVCEL